MKKHFLLAALMALTCLPALSRADMQAGDKPTLKFKAFGSKKDIDLADYKGKIIIVDFWATWCHPCMNEADHMVAVNEKYQSKGLQFIGISLDQDQNSLKKVIADKKFTWPQNFEGKAWKGETPVAWGINSIPQTFIIGPDGSVLWRGHPAEIDKALAAAFKDHPPVLTTSDKSQDAIAVANQLKADKKDLEAYPAYKSIVKTYPGTAAASDAAAAVKSYESDSAFMMNYNNTVGKKEAEALLSMADTYRAAGNVDKARVKYQAVIDRFPNTPWAQTARKAISSLGTSAASAN